MGKRNFKKPDDSDSEYEWEEAEPKKQLIVNKEAKPGNELDGFLNQYSTKSLTQIRSDKNQDEKDKQTKLYEERVYKPSSTSSIKMDPKWLKKSFNRCKEQALEQGIDVVVLLKERYEDDVVGFMMRTFDRNYSHNRSERNYSHQRSEKNYSNDRSETNYSHEKSGKKYDKERGIVSAPNKQLESNEDTQGDDKVVEERYVTEADINEACASLMRAEMSGNSSKASKLEKRVHTLRDAQKRNLKIRLTRQKREDEVKREVMIQKPLKSGKMVPYVESASKFVSQTRPYDSVNCSIKELLREEQGIDGEENDLAFARMTGKVRSGVKTIDEIGDCEYNDVFVHKTTKNTDKMLLKEKQKAISVHKHHTAQVGSCKLCYSKLPKHLVLGKGDYFCMIVPVDLGITEFHCKIVPLDHVAAATQITDDDAWDELTRFKKRIVEFFDRELQSETVFMETVKDLKSYPHTTIDCIPLTRSRPTFAVSNAVFFKKSIDEAKSEWCQNKKVLDLKAGDIRQTVPKQFPYFAVEFDMAGGYAVVIDDEQSFSVNFGMEVVGSLLEKDLIEINNRKEKSFNQQADVVLRYEKRWKKYNLWTNEDSDDDSD